MQRDLQRSSQSMKHLTAANQELTQKLEELSAKVTQLEKELAEQRSLSQRELTMQRILVSDSNTMKYTGVPSTDLLHGMLDIANQSYPIIKYWQGKKSAQTMSYEGTRRRKPGPKRSLTRLQEMVLTLARLRTGMPVWMLAHMFDISDTTVIEIFTTWIKILSKITAPLRRWPHKESIKKHMPPSIKKDYPNTTVIIDCSEFYIQKPRNPTTQSQTYSSYKSHNTYKSLLGISPSGSFIYVSELYGGNSSDKYMVEHSDFLDYIQPGDDVMADRGFTIRGLLANKSATLK